MAAVAILRKRKSAVTAAVRHRSRWNFTNIFKITCFIWKFREIFELKNPRWWQPPFWKPNVAYNFRKSPQIGMKYDQHMQNGYL